MLNNRKQPGESLGRTGLYCCLGITLLLFTACTPRATHHPPASLTQASFSASGQTVLPDQWWLTFADPTLNQLIDQALDGNFSLKSAWQRLDQARAAARKSGAELVPNVNGEAGLSTTRTETNSLSNASQSFSLGLAASYEVDLWGRLHSASRAAELDALASAETLQAAALTLTAQVATTWFQLREEHGQREILEQQLNTNSKTLELISLQFRTGQVGIADLLQQRQVVENRRGELALADSRAILLRNKLAALLGLPPAQAPQLTAGAELTLPQLPATGLQSILLARRPDVRAAWLKVQASDQRLAAAAADRFPRLSLTGRASTTAEQIEKLFDNWLASLAANLLAPLVDGGRRQAEVERNRALTAEALHSYGQTVLDALVEVEDALTREEKQLEYLASIDRQLALAEQATGRIRDRYLHGAENYQRVLTALLSEQQLQRSRLSARRELFENRVKLCRSLAGGWEMSQQLKSTDLTR